MANQYNAKIRFQTIAWRATDPESGAVLTIIDHRVFSRSVQWSVRLPGTDDVDRGESKTPAAARAAARAHLARILKRQRVAT